MATHPQSMDGSLQHQIGTIILHIDFVLLRCLPVGWMGRPSTCIVRLRAPVAIGTGNCLRMAHRLSGFEFDGHGSSSVDRWYAAVHSYIVLPDLHPSNTGGRGWGGMR